MPRWPALLARAHGFHAAKDVLGEERSDKDGDEGYLLQRTKFGWTFTERERQEEDILIDSLLLFSRGYQARTRDGGFYGFRGFGLGVPSLGWEGDLTGSSLLLRVGRQKGKHLSRVCFLWLAGWYFTLLQWVCGGRVLRLFRFTLTRDLRDLLLFSTRLGRANAMLSLEALCVLVSWLGVVCCESW